MLAAPLSAQMCEGTASFSAGKMGAGIGFGSTDGSSSLEGSFKYGVPSGYFANAMVSTIDIDGTTESMTGYGITGGKSVLVGTAKKVEMCPQLMLAGSSGNGFSTMSIGGGASFGTKLDASKSFDLIPFASALIARNSIEAGGVSDSQTDLFAAFGAGFVFSKVWTIRPSVSFPLTGDNHDASFNLLGTINFGK